MFFSEENVGKRVVRNSEGGKIEELNEQVYYYRHSISEILDELKKKMEKMSILREGIVAMHITVMRPYKREE
jgi:hypothetical protein